LLLPQIVRLSGHWCAVTGTAVRDVLDAAHLPGRDWRVVNEASDGVLLRADLHRLLDRGIAEIRGDTFTIVDAARASEYVEYDGTPFCRDPVRAGRSLQPVARVQACVQRMHHASGRGADLGLDHLVLHRLAGPSSLSPVPWRAESCTKASGPQPWA
jgi:hypothetical protein